MKSGKNLDREKDGRSGRNGKRCDCGLRSTMTTGNTSSKKIEEDIPVKMSSSSRLKVEASEELPLSAF